MADDVSRRPTSKVLASLPIDPDLAVTRVRGNLSAVRRRLDVLAAIAVGGMVGSTARYGVALAVPGGTGQFPWGTFVANVSGSALLGMLLVLLTERYVSGRYLRPFLGTGVLGSYTTFSTYMVDTALLVHDNRPGLAAVYVTMTLMSGLGAVWFGVVIGRVLAGIGRV